MKEQLQWYAGKAQELFVVAFKLAGTTAGYNRGYIDGREIEKLHTPVQPQIEVPAINFKPEIHVKPDIRIIMPDDNLGDPVPVMPRASNYRTKTFPSRDTDSG